MHQPEVDILLDAAAHQVTEHGFGSVTLPAIAARTGIAESAILADYGSLDDLLVGMLNREYARMFRAIIDDIERDPLGGLLSRIYLYTFTAVYERPLARALYLTDPRGLNTIMRASHAFSYVPRLGPRADFVERMKAVGMVRPDVSAEHVSAIVSAVSAGAALTAPHADLGDVTHGLSFLLRRAVDADVRDTSPGKAVFVEYAASLASRNSPE